MDLKRLKANPGIVLGAAVLVIAAIIILLWTSGVFEEENLSSVDPANSLININTADAEELTKLDGISDVLAERIVEYREENGKFSSTEEVKEVYGIGDGIYKKIKNYIKTE